MSANEPPPLDRYLVRGADDKIYPADLMTLKRWVSEGRIARHTQVFRDGVGPWRTAVEFVELFPPEPPVVVNSGSARQSAAISGQSTSVQRGVGCSASIALILFGVLFALFGHESSTLGLAGVGLLIAGVIVGIISAAQRS